MSVTLLNRDMLIRRKANGTAFAAAASVGRIPRATGLLLIPM
jgi:hypothetical protein